MDEFNEGHKEVLWQLFRDGPTWDGDIVSKQARDDLTATGYVCRYNGWQSLRKAGLIACVKLHYGDRKSVEENVRRRNTIDMDKAREIIVDGKVVKSNTSQRSA